MAVVEWTDQALEDLDTNAAFIARDSHYYAKIFVSRILSSVEQLVDFPEIGRGVPEVSQADIREIIHGNYRIIYQYRESNSLVTILTIYHSARILTPESL